MASRLGLECKAYRNTGTYGAPTWDEVTNIRDLTLSLEKGESDVSTRSTGGWRARRGVLKDAKIEWQMVWDTADTDFTAFRNSFLNGTSIDMLFLDGSVSTTGSQGFRADIEIFSFSRNENLEEAVMVDVSAMPTYSTNAPTWYTVP